MIGVSSVQPRDEAPRDQGYLVIWIILSCY